MPDARPRRNGRSRGSLSRIVKYILKRRRLLKGLRGTRYAVDHFEHPIGYRTIAKHILVKTLEIFFYSRLRGRHVPFIRRSFTNEAVAKLPGGPRIFVFLHQPFIHYLSALLCGKGFAVNALGRGDYCPDFIRQMAETESYTRHAYKPVTAFRDLRDRLSKGESLLLAADGRAGLHYLDVRFGRGSVATPKGIYMLSLVSGAGIVPVFLHLKGVFPFPRFEIRIGPDYIIEGPPEDEIQKIGAIFSWFFEQCSKQPYMWSRIADPKFALRQARPGPVGRGLVG